MNNIFKRINQDLNKTLILVKITIKNKITSVNTQQIKKDNNQ